MENTTYEGSAILPSGEAGQEPEHGLEAWTPEEFDHFTDLGLLRSVGLVDLRRDGKRVLYRTNTETLKTIHDWTSTFQRHWSGQLNRIKRHAERKKEE